MDVGEEFDYAGPAQRAEQQQQLQVAGRFRVLVVDGGAGVLIVEDARVAEGELPAEPPELHRYVLLQADVDAAAGGAAG